MNLLTNEMEPSLRLNTSRDGSRGGTRGRDASKMVVSPTANHSLNNFSHEKKVKHGHGPPIV